MKFTKILFVFIMLALVLPVFALSLCPRCGYRIGFNDLKCKKCLKNLSPELSQEKPTKSTISVRIGEDCFIRHPHANNRAYKSDRNAGGDAQGEIGVWGGPSTLRYLINFYTEEAAKMQNVDMEKFFPKKATLYISAVKNKSNIEIPVAVYPVIHSFTAGVDRFRTREKPAKDCTWYYRSTAMMWDIEGGDFDRRCVSRGVIRSGERNAVDVTEVIKYFFEKARIDGDYAFPGMIIMSDPGDRTVKSGFVTVYSFEADDYTLRPELFIE